MERNEFFVSWSKDSTFGISRFGTEGSGKGVMFNFTIIFTEIEPLIPSFSPGMNARIVYSFDDIVMAPDLSEFGSMSGDPYRHCFVVFNLPPPLLPCRPGH